MVTNRPAEITTPSRTSLSGAGPLGRLETLRRVPGRNRTKADLLVCRSALGLVAVKDYGARPWWLRNTLGRLLVRRETAAYRQVAGVAGLPRFFGRLGAFALATEWIEARRLADFRDRTVDAVVFDRLAAILDALHGRGLAVADLSYRDVLIGADGAVHLVDLAASWRRGSRSWGWRLWLFRRLRAADRFALARLRARFVGDSDQARVAAEADRSAVAWHRRARRLKWRWDRWRGAERLPPVDDHWRR